MGKNSQFTSYISMKKFYIIVCLLMTFSHVIYSVEKGSKIAGIEFTVQPGDKPVPQRNTYIDRIVYPKGYTILTSDKLMFPDNVANLPVKIDLHHQLFVDDYLVASVKGLKRQIHQPVKHLKNPLIFLDKPWEVTHIFLDSVYYDSKTKKFRMWYNSNFALYAESKNGINWYKPELGLVEFNGSAKNNILTKGGLSIIRVEQNHQQKQNRYIAFVRHVSPFVKQKGYYLYHSPDGLHWKGDLSGHLLTCTWNSQLPEKGISDTSTFRYDPILKRYICDSKSNLYFHRKDMRRLGIGVGSKKNRIRCRTMLESQDLIHWIRPRFTFFPDEHDGSDAQIYGHVGFVYESMWLGMLRVMHTIPTGWKQVDVQLTYSRDGRHWSRPDEREVFLPLGNANSWDADHLDLANNGPLLVGDELWFYYRGFRKFDRDKKKYDTVAFGLAKLRRDGFASLNADQAPGQITTRPLTFEGRKLFVNADVEKDGWIKAAVLTRDSNSVELYTLDDSIAMTKNTTKGRMVWKSKKELVPPPGDEHLRLVFQLKNAKLYSFWIE